MTLSDGWLLFISLSLQLKSKMIMESLNEVRVLKKQRFFYKRRMGRLFALLGDWRKGYDVNGQR